ncbi:MAG: RNA polymerase sigma factor [Acidobacteriota bacterium]
MAKEIIISNTDESELIERCRKGEQQAFAEIVRRYKGRVASTVTGMLGRGDHAEDIGQEVFIRLFNAVDSFRGDSSLGTYITRIAINLSLNEIRRRKLRSLLSFESLKEDGVEIEDKGSGEMLNENKEIVQKAIQKLSAKYRSVVVLRLIDDYSTEETAKILNLPLGTVLSRLARAQIKLKEYLEPFISEI